VIAIYFNPVGTVQQATTENKSQTAGRNELGKDQFLNLLITQLKYQDPFQPLSDQEFIAQLAQFSSLEQMQNLNTNMVALMMSQQRLTALGEATRMIGKQVELRTANGEQLFGEVTGVQFKDGWPQLIVDGKLYGFDEVVSILKGGE
jgi:flagellar basal-body rod modification protein FlgD